MAVKGGHVIGAVKKRGEALTVKGVDRSRELEKKALVPAEKDD